MFSEVGSSSNIVASGFRQTNKFSKEKNVYASNLNQTTIFSSAF